MDVEQVWLLMFVMWAFTSDGEGTVSSRKLTLLALAVELPPQWPSGEESLSSLKGVAQVGL